MQIHIKYGYRGEKTNEVYYPPGVYGEATFSFEMMAYLVKNTHAEWFDESPDHRNTTAIIESLVQIEDKKKKNESSEYTHLSADDMDLGLTLLTSRPLSDRKQK